MMRLYISKFFVLTVLATCSIFARAQEKFVDYGPAKSLLEVELNALAG